MGTTRQNAIIRKREILNGTIVSGGGYFDEKNECAFERFIQGDMSHSSDVIII